MWQTEWQRPPAGPTPYVRDRRDSALRPWHVDMASVLLWEEHCVECAVPECYAVCPLYVAREDRQCARFRYGICPDPAFSGLFPFGARISFRRWGKLEARIAPGGMSPRLLAWAAGLDRAILKPLTSLSRLMRPLNPQMKLNRGYRKLRERALHQLGRWRFRHDIAHFDDLVVEAWNESDRSVRMVLECHEDRRVMHRSAFSLHSGHNLVRIPAREFELDGESPFRMQLYPDADRECEVVFTWLDFVKYTLHARTHLRPADKVKCVVWDLDGTLWDGTLAEDGPDAVSPRGEVLELIRRLDERGIVQSVASKNDHESAWQKITSLRLEEYLLFPAINWEPKSRNLPKIAKQFDIGLDTIAFIDDSPAERAEVVNELPHVRAYAETDVATLLDRAEFDVPVTDASRLRRRSYVAEARRRTESTRFSDDPDDFLAQCRLVATIFRPRLERDKTRCLELLHRSNQLNLATRRYTEDEFLALLADPRMSIFALRCRDRYGDYGLVGVVAVRRDDDAPMLLDFVMSCRVAHKRVEHAVVGWLQEHLAAGESRARIRAVFHATPRNGKLWEVLVEIGFKVVEKGDKHVRIELSAQHAPPRSGIVRVKHEDAGTCRRG